VAYVIEPASRSGTRYVGIYRAANGKYKSAGTYTSHERAYEVAEEEERHARGFLEETSPAGKATMTIAEFCEQRFLRYHAVSPGTRRRLSVGGLVISVALGGAMEDVRGWRDLGFGRLQDRVVAGAGPGGESLAEVAVVGVRGRDRQALPVPEPVGEGAAGGGQVLDPLACISVWLVRGRGELVALGLGGGRGFGGAQRGEWLAGVSVA
jgi:hypothetical protein